MGTTLVYGPLAVAAIGFIIFIAGVGHLLHGRAGKASLGLGSGGVLAIAGLAVGLVGLNLQSYARLTYEAPVAEVSVKAINPAQKIYTVTLRRLDGTGRVQSCSLQGDGWEIAGRYQVWKPWANEIGLNATYTLDQLSNRYWSAREANGRPITACDIAGPQPKVTHLVPDSWVRWMLAHMLVRERMFGSANFMPMADGALYRVVATRTGFNAESANAAAMRANNARAF
jgi:hypothetical protein